MLFQRTVRLFSRQVLSKSSATLWTVSHHGPLSRGFPRQESQSVLPFFFSRESSWPRDHTCISCIGGWLVTSEPLEKPFQRAAHGWLSALTLSQLSHVIINRQILTSWFTQQICPRNVLCVPEVRDLTERASQVLPAPPCLWAALLASPADRSSPLLGPMCPHQRNVETVQCPPNRANQHEQIQSFDFSCLFPNSPYRNRRHFSDLKIAYLTWEN